jgi:hypothetical protein
VINTNARESGSASIHNFGFTNPGGAVWLIMVCENCANVQIFRPDYNGRGGVDDPKWAKFAGKQ